MVLSKRVPTICVATRSELRGLLRSSGRAFGLAYAGIGSLGPGPFPRPTEPIGAVCRPSKCQAPGDVEVASHNLSV